MKYSKGVSFRGENINEIRHTRIKIRADFSQPIGFLSLNLIEYNPNRQREIMITSKIVKPPLPNEIFRS